MKKLVFFFFCALSFIAQAQPHSDSIRHFRDELFRLRRQNDSILLSSKEYREALEGYERQRKRRNPGFSYSAFTLLTGIMHSDYSAFNESMATSGFPALKENSWQGGFGSSFQHGSLMIDVYAFRASAARSGKPGEKITVSLFNVVQFDFGYDLVRSKWIAAYPFAGLSVRHAAINYKRDTQYNPGFTNISNLAADQASLHVTSTRAGYQAGIGFDLMLSQNKERSSGIVFFVKGGVNRPVWRDRFRKGGYTLMPVQQGDWTLGLGIKFASME